MSLEVAAGEMVAVMGPSGPGKTSVTHVACGLLAPTWGTIEVGGGPQEVPDRRGWARLRRQTIAVVHQRLDLLSTSALMGVVVASTVAGAATVGAVAATAANARRSSSTEPDRDGPRWSRRAPWPAPAWSRPCSSDWPRPG